MQRQAVTEMRWRQLVCPRRVVVDCGRRCLVVIRERDAGPYAWLKGSCPH